MQSKSVIFKEFLATNVAHIVELILMQSLYMSFQDDADFGFEITMGASKVTLFRMSSHHVRMEIG